MTGIPVLAIRFRNDLVSIFGKSRVTSLDSFGGKYCHLFSRNLSDRSSFRER